MRHSDQRRPLPADLTLAERDFYLELRRLIDIAGLSFRALEGSTAARSASGQTCFYSKTQWGRWLNGESRPPWKAIKKLSEKVSAEGIDTGGVLDLWARAFMASAPPRPTAGPPVRPRQLPAAVAHFTGRAAELDALNLLAKEAADAGGRVVITAIRGTAGVGKTALAVHWAHQVANQFPDGQLYLNLRGHDPSGVPVAPTEAIRGFLDALAVPAELIRVGQDAQAGLYRSLLAGKQMLIVLDNARDAAQIRPLLPGAAGCLVLVTSRSQLTGLAAAEGASLLTLEVLTDDEARDLLARRLGTRRVTAEPEAVSKLMTLCARLPLALSIVAARAAARPCLSLGELARELADSGDRLDALDAGDPAASVRAVFSWSYQQLSLPAAQLFRLLGLHAGPDITVPAAASLAGIAPGRARMLIAELADANLIAEHAPGRYAFHDLLRAYAADLGRTSDGEAERAEALHRVLDHYLHTAHHGSRLLNPARPQVAMEPPRPGVTAERQASPSEALAWFAAERHVLLAAITQASDLGFDTHAWQLPWTLVLFFDRQGLWNDQVAIQHIAIAAAKRLGDQAAQAHASRDLGWARYRQGAPNEALAYFQHALDLHTQLGDRPGRARAHYDIAAAAEQLGLLSEALRHAQQSLVLVQAEGSDPAGLSRALNGVGWLYAQMGDHEQALRCCERALGLIRGLGDPLNEAATLDSVGFALYHLGRHHEAIGFLREAVGMTEGMGVQYLQAQVLIHLGDACQADGAPDDARRAWREAEAIFDRLQHPDAEQARAKLTLWIEA